ncbi:MAG: PRC-barrel domain-containing protein [Bacillota bacterium]
MRRRREVLGLPVIDLANGRRVGDLEELYIDLQSQAVVGFLVTQGRWLVRRYLLKADDVVAVGPDAATIEDREVLVPFSRVARTPFTYEKQLVGKRVLSPHGEDLGTIADVFLDDHELKVTAYEISGGLLADLLDGKTVLAAVPVVIGKDAVVITDQ